MPLSSCLPLGFYGAFLPDLDIPRLLLMQTNSNHPEEFSRFHKIGWFFLHNILIWGFRETLFLKLGGREKIFES
jgi:hypothetical protein